MTDLLATLGGLIAALGNTQSGAVLKERLALILERLAMAQQEVAKLQAENASLRHRAEEAEKQIASQRVSPDMTQHRGAYFRRDAAGGWEPVVYCYSCRVPMFGFAGDGFNCPKCGGVTPFTEAELAAVMAGLPR